MRRDRAEDVSAKHAREREVLRHTQEAFIAENLKKDEVEEQGQRERFEGELTAQDSRISPEAARRLYDIQVTLHELFDRAQTLEGLTHGELQILLALGNELLTIESKKGVIPALLSVRGNRQTRYKALTHPPSQLFGPYVIGEYFYQGERTQQEILDVLEFAHTVHQWTTGYYQTNRDVGSSTQQEMTAALEKLRTARPGDTITDKEVKRALATQENPSLPSANYLADWRAVPFPIFKTLVEGGMLKKLPFRVRSREISSILDRSVNELLRRDYYNPAILEEPPRVIPALEILYGLKEYYAMSTSEKQSLRDKIHDRFYSLINHPDFLAYYDTEAQKAFGKLVSDKGQDYDLL